MAAYTLKLRDSDSEPVLPGLALPEAFESLGKRLDSTVKLCKLSSPPDGQVLSVITICEELQRLLKHAFIENGLLASRLEIFTRYHSESLKKINKTVSAFDVEHKVTKKQIKRLRKKISVNDTYQRRKNQKWWDVEVRSTDYESFSILSRSSGSPDLEFMLRVNQILIDFVRDEEKTELLLPPMGHEERAELSKMASIYKIRCRYGKSTQLASSTLMKARQTCIPGHGEVDAILDGFARAQNLKRLTVSAEEGIFDDTKHEVVVTVADVSTSKGKSKSPPISTIPSTMLTPLSSLAIDISGITSTPSQSPPTSGMSTPTEMMKGRRDSSDKEKVKSRSRCGSLSSNENPLPASGIRATAKGGHSLRSSPQTSPRPCPNTTSSTSTPPTAATVGGGVLSGGSAPPIPPPTIGSLTSLHMPSHGPGGQQAKPPGGMPLSGGIQRPPLITQLQTSQSASPLGGIFLHHHSAVRPMGHPTVVASPLKVPVSQLPRVVKSNLSVGGIGGGGGGCVGGGGGTGTGSSKGGGLRVDGEEGVAEEGGKGVAVGSEGGGAKEGGGSGGAGGKRESLLSGTGAQPPKRIRLTRKSAGLGIIED